MSFPAARNFGLVSEGWSGLGSGMVLAPPVVEDSFCFVSVESVQYDGLHGCLKCQVITILYAILRA